MVLIAIDDEMYNVKEKDYDRLIECYNELKSGNDEMWRELEEEIKTKYKSKGRVQTFFN